MLVEWFLTFCATILGLIAGLFGAWDAPAELLNATGAARDLLTQFASVGVWINWPVLNGCITATVITWATVLLIRLARAVLAHFPAFGGSGD